MTARILALLMLQFAGQQIWAQALPSSSLTIDAYIHQGWDSLSRSMSECKSLVDPKVTAGWERACLKKWGPPPSACWVETVLYRMLI